MTAQQRAWVQRRRDAAHDAITNAYWTFTRTARGIPTGFDMPMRAISIYQRDDDLPPLFPDVVDAVAGTEPA